MRAQEGFKCFVLLLRDVADEDVRQVRRLVAHELGEDRGLQQVDRQRERDSDPESDQDHTGMHSRSMEIGNAVA